MDQPRGTPQGFRWQTAREGDVTLDAIRAFVDEVAQDLDPGSRYVRELRAVLEASSDVNDYMARLCDAERVDTFRGDGSRASKGERGRSWVDRGTWEEMDPFERTLSNLLTGETRMMWAGEGAVDFGCLSEVLRGEANPVRVLSVPCSTGKEPFSIVIAGLLAGLELRVVGVDRQDPYLERARSGVLVPHWRDRELEGVDPYLSWDEGQVRSRVAPEVLERCTFEQGDVLTGRLPAGPFALVSCRNLLGYFRGESLETAWRNVAARVAPGGSLLLDPFVTGSEEMAAVRRLLEENGFTRRFPHASYYTASAGWGS